MIPLLMSSPWVHPLLRTLKPYQPGKPIGETKRQFGLQQVYKLASNENPLGPNPNVVQVCTEALRESHLYPDGASIDLRKSLSDHYGVPSDQLVVGNGSDELISLLIRVFCLGFPGARVLTPQYAFVAYRIAALSHQIAVDEAPLLEDWKVNCESLTAQWRPETRIIFLANPNNPTGAYLSAADLRRVLDFAEARGTLVVVDEAYFEYVRAQDYLSGLDLLNDYSCLVIFRTFSKAYGMAGLRLGVLIASPEVADLINRVRSPFNTNLLAQLAGRVAIQDQAYVRRGVELTWGEMDRVKMSLEKMGFRVTPSQGNFLLFDTGQKAQALFEKMLAKGVIVRPVTNYGLPQHLRVSMGLAHENEAFLKALGESV